MHKWYSSITIIKNGYSRVTFHKSRNGLVASTCSTSLSREPGVYLLVNITQKSLSHHSSMKVVWLMIIMRKRRMKIDWAPFSTCHDLSNNKYRAHAKNRLDVYTDNGRTNWRSMTEINATNLWLCVDAERPVPSDKPSPIWDRDFSRLTNCNSRSRTLRSIGYISSAFDELRLAFFLITGENWHRNSLRGTQWRLLVVTIGVHHCFALLFLKNKNLSSRIDKTEVTNRKTSVLLVIVNINLPSPSLCAMQRVTSERYVAR